MMDSRLVDRPVLVAVADPDRVEQLVRTASDLARVGSETVQIVSIVSKSHDSPVAVYSDETIIERFAQDTQAMLDTEIAVAPNDVSVKREILVDRSVADGLLTAIDEIDPGALVMGWQGDRSRADAILGTNVDRLIEHAPCDLYVEREGYEADGVDSILVPIAGGPHVRPAMFAAKAIAARNSASVHILSVEPGDSQTATTGSNIEQAVREIEDMPGPSVEIKTLLTTGDTIPDVITETVADHDVLIFGVTRRSSVRRRLVGSIPREVIPRVDRTVLLARSADAVEHSSFGRLRRLWRD
jgi:nucleotide-binding universal stress UspA family protein